MGDFGKIVPYCAKFGYKPNFVFILQNLVHSNPKAAQEFGTQLVKVRVPLFTAARVPRCCPASAAPMPPFPSLLPG